MDIDQPIAPAVDEVRCEHAHEAREADQLNAACFQRIAQRLFEGGAGFVRPVVDNPMGEACAFGPGEPEGGGPVGEHQHDLARGVGAGAIVDESLEIGPAARNQDTHSQPRHIVPCRPATPVPGLLHVALFQTP